MRLTTKIKCILQLIILYFYLNFLNIKLFKINFLIFNIKFKFLIYCALQDDLNI